MADPSKFTRNRKADTSKKSNAIILSVILLICLSIPIFYYFYVREEPNTFDPQGFLTQSKTIRADLDFGEAWFYSKAIAVQDGYGGHIMVRVSLRVPSRDSALKVCERHPHLADMVLRMFEEDPELRDNALNGENRAGKTLFKALEKRLGGDLFSEARLVDIKTEGHEQQVQPISYECSHIGVRVILRKAPEGLRYHNQKFKY